MIQIDFPLDPRWGRKNGKYTLAKGQRRLVLTTGYRNFVKAVAAFTARHMVQTGQRGLVKGGLAISIVLTWSDSGHRADVDAVQSAVLDGLQAGGLVRNDRQFDELHVRIRTGSPGFSVLIYRPSSA